MDTVPPPVAEAVRVLAVRGDEHLASHEWPRAAETFDRAYALLLENQRSGRRFDKAAVLLRRGLAEVFGDFGPAAPRRSGILSLIETVLTHLEVNPDHTPNGLEWQEARNAQTLANLPVSLVRGLVRDLRGALQEQPAELGDPERVAFMVGIADMWAIGGVEGRPVHRPGEFEVPWAERVFIGGSYQSHIADLAEIAHEVRRFGWTPVLVWDYSIPAGFVHHHSLMLLHECRWAIFEVTAAGGQFMELERCRDYMIEPLVVHQGRGGHGRISSMVGDLLARLGITPRSYSDTAGLRAEVRSYLQAAAGRPVP